jgi:hypothetical protein
MYRSGAAWAGLAGKTVYQIFLWTVYLAVLREHLAALLTCSDGGYLNLPQHYQRPRQRPRLT